MKTHRLLLLGLIGWGAPAVFAQALTPPPTNPAAAAADKPQPPAKPLVPAGPKPDRAVSSEVAATISAGMPKYNPPPKLEPKSEEELPDLRDTDKPKNQIIRLPKYIVREPRNPVLRERDVNTKAGLAALAVRRYITDADRALSPFTLPLFGTSPEARALAMYAEDERLKNMAELNDDAAMASATDKANGAYIRREAQKTYMRTNDFGWNGGGAK